MTSLNELLQTLYSRVGSGHNDRCIEIHKIPRLVCFTSINDVHVCVCDWAAVQKQCKT